MRLINDQLIKKWEELRLVAYLPTPHDKWTIGWGHTKGVKQGDEISREQAQMLFDSDVKWAVAAVNRDVNVRLTQTQFDALVSLVFNIGEANFKRSTLLKKLNRGDYEGAALEFPKWNKQRQNGKLVVLRGLVRRRAEEMEYFMSPHDEAQKKAETAHGPDPLKPLSLSKEVWGGVGAALTGGGALLGGLAPGAQNILSVAASVALLGFGAYFIWNRIQARNRAER